MLFHRCLAFTLSGIYTIVDGFFIGQSLGDVGLAAITLGYPISALVGAIGTGLGSSGSIRYTSLNAQDETQKQEERFSGTILLMLLVGAILSVTLFGLSAPILRLLGAQRDSDPLRTVRTYHCAGCDLSAHGNHHRAGSHHGGIHRFLF